MVPIANDASRDNNFVPAFYLKKWIVARKQRLVEYRRCEDHAIRPRWTGPRGTGYKNTYAAEDGSVESLEGTFMTLFDTHAVDLLGIAPSTSKLAWAKKRRYPQARLGGEVGSIATHSDTRPVYCNYQHATTRS